MEKKAYALETMNEGVLIVSKEGKITYANRRAKDIFDIRDDAYPIFRSVLENSQADNDGLIDMVIDIISSGEIMHSNGITYTNRSGRKYYLYATCTRMSDDDYVVTVTDNTELMKEGKRRMDSTTILILFFMIACLWTIGVTFWMRAGEPFPVGWLTQIVEVVGIASIFFITRKTDLKIMDMGLSPKNIVATIKRTVLRLAVLLAFMSLVKLIALQVYPSYFPAGRPFWDWSQADSRLIKYLGTAFLQEFMARGGVQNSLANVIWGKHAQDRAIHITSIYFMALHFQYGIPMMIGAGVLSIILGYMYKHDGNIYGITLVHYCFGKFADFLSLI